MKNKARVVPVSTRLEKKHFIQLPWLLHGNDPNWVPPLRSIVKKNLDTTKNPFYAHAELKTWVAYRNKKPIGRIAGIINHAHNHYYNNKTAFWGFFECENDVHTTTALFQCLEQWAHQQGMDNLQGPVNPSTNHECGLQVSAFDTKPFIMMPQNPSYYPPLIEAAGHTKAKDLNAWLISSNAKFNEKLMAKVDKISHSSDIKTRFIDMNKYEEEIEKIFTVYNDAWEKNWGFVPLNYDEFFYLANEIKPILIPQSILIVEVKNEIAAFGIWLPDMNQILIRIRNGKLLPTGLAKLFWHTKIKKTITQGRILALGVRHQFFHLHLGVLLYTEFYKTLPPLGYPLAECSWVLEDNIAMNTSLQLMNAQRYKTYRLYEKKLT